MARTLIALVLGIALGGAAAWLFLADRPLPPELGAERPTGPARRPAETAPRSDFYRRLADAGAAELAAMIGSAAAQPASADRDLTLAVLLQRYAELDAPRAARLARETSAGTAALGAVYSAWAQTEPAAAVAALDAVEDADDAAAIGLVLIVELGNDAAALERVAARLAARDSRAPIASIVPPFGAGLAPVPWQASATAPPSALALMAQQWAELDPDRALGLIANVRDEPLGLALEAAAVRALARAAPDRAFAHLRAIDESRQLALFGAAGPELSRADPERLLGLAGNLSPALRRLVEATALQQLAERDPLAAARYFERLPAGRERQTLGSQVARSYGKLDAAAALAWARALPERQALVPSVLGGIAEENFDLALELSRELTPIEQMRALQLAVMSGLQRDDRAEDVANRVAALDDVPLRDQLVTSVVSMWSSRSPDDAMRWLLANSRDHSPTLFQQLGQQLAMQDPQRAVAYTVQVPEAARESWVQGVAHTLAQTEPQRAVDWLGEFRGQPLYARAAMSVAPMLAQQDGAAAARLVDELETIAPSVDMQRLVNVVVTNWANYNPAAAVQWVVDRPAEQDRTLGIRSAVAVWSMQDPLAARQWTLRQPQSALRDAALAALVAAGAGFTANDLDLGLLSAFTSDTERQRAVLQLVQGLAYRDPGRALAIADANLTTPALREQAERVIEAARESSGSVQTTVDRIRAWPPALPPLPR